MNHYEIDSCGFGLLVDTTNQKSSLLVQKALSGLSRLSHRGAVGEDGVTGDGCGIMLQLDHAFFAQIAQEQSIQVPNHFAIGSCLLSPVNPEKNKIRLEDILKRLGFSIAGWRDVPVNLNYAGKQDHLKIPIFCHLFVTYPIDWSLSFIEKKLYQAKILAQQTPKFEEPFYLSSLSTQTIIYKALVLPGNLPLFYPDLQDKRLSSAVALFHQRFSTNTSSAWHLAQPFSTLAHNGEINTIQGNRHYGERISYSLIKNYYPELKDVETLITPGGSDSLSMDNLLEGLIHAPFSCPEAMRLMIPPAWENDTEMTEIEKSYFRFHAPHLPAWEGPAGIVFFDGRYAGCILDKNGFRPARCVSAKPNWIGIGSEAGIFDFKNEEIISLSRLKPGEIFLIDLVTGSIIDSQKLIQELCQKHPYFEWEKNYSTELFSITQNLPPIKNSISPNVLKRFDVSFEETEQVLRFIAEQATEPTHSMGDDTPLAAFSSQPRQLFDFFRQQFAQVTNPPVDSLREKSILSLETYLGNRRLITNRDAEFARQIVLSSPLLTKLQFEELSTQNKRYFKIIKISLAYHYTLTLREAINNLKQYTLSLPQDIHHLFILSDEKISANQNSIHPSLAIGALHHQLIENHQREAVSLIACSGWVREAHHVAVLLAYGADAVYPWLAYKLLQDIGYRNHYDLDEAFENYRNALNKGLLKICSKMGVCTLNSYKGAQLFNVIGLHSEIMGECFSQSSYWLPKYNWETLDQQQKTFYLNAQDTTILPRQGGMFQYAPQGEYHDYNPDVVTNLLRAVNENDARYYQQFKELVNYRPPVMVRDFLQLNPTRSPVKLSDVEDSSSILKRFDTAAMSLGALSPEAHEALAIAMNQLGGRSNSGEGGEAKYRQGTLKHSKIKQIASARFGVTAEYLIHAEVIQIKIAQGAKPGEGGQLPGNKVNKMIAELRYSTPGVTLISPPPHHDIYSIEDLAQLIFDLKQVNPKALVSVKLVSEPGVGTVAAGVVKAYADLITISGYDGGTGASPLSSIRSTGCPWEYGLNETHRTLIAKNLRHRVTLQVDGGLKTGLDVIKAALLGAESFGFGTAPMITLGCKYLRICHLNNCATGIATQDDRLRAHYYHGLPERVMLYFQWVAEEVRELLALLGVTHLKDIIGRVDLLKSLPQSNHCVDLSQLLAPNPVSRTYTRELYLQRPNHPFDKALLAQKLLQDVTPALRHNDSYYGEYSINNKDRSIGANIAGEIARLYGDTGYKSQIQLHFNGFAGQSFGAFLVQGMSFSLQGAANDYVGKGMNGGELIIRLPEHSSLNPLLTTIAGNTCLYGATGGTCFINGLAGERFAVRNSGSTAVVLGIGNHGCEYMTAGEVLVLSTPGANFAAGMTGGMAFVYDDKGAFPKLCNQESVTLCHLDHTSLHEYQHILRKILTDFNFKTQSVPGKSLLGKLEQCWSKFYVILPKENCPALPPLKEAR